MRAHHGGGGGDGGGSIPDMIANVVRYH